MNPTPLERVTPLRELPACGAPDVFLRVTVKLPRLSGFIVLPRRPVFARCNTPIGREKKRGMKLVSTGNVELISVAPLSPRSADKRFRGMTLLFRFNVSYNRPFPFFFFFFVSTDFVAFRAGRGVDYESSGTREYVRFCKIFTEERENSLLTFEKVNGNLTRRNSFVDCKLDVKIIVSVNFSKRSLVLWKLNTGLLSRKIWKVSREVKFFLNYF